MDARFLDYYNRELAYLRELGGEFAEAFPKIGGRLGLRGDEVADPYVERLLEGFAFLSSRIHLKMDAEFPRFSQRLLEVVYPHYLAPTPAMAVVQLLKSGRLDGQAAAEAWQLPRATQLQSGVVAGTAARCTFTTAHALDLWPYEIVSVQAGPPGEQPEAGKFGAAARLRGVVRVRMRPMGERLPERGLADQMLFHATGDDAQATHLFELLVSQCLGVTIGAVGGGRPPHRLQPSAISHEGFSADQALLPTDARVFQGYRLLHEYFAFPQRFLFFSLRGVKQIFQQLGGEQIELTFLLGRDVGSLAGSLDEHSLALNCVPVVNLFPQTGNRVLISAGAVEHHLVPDRNRPLDFEVYRVGSVQGLDRGNTVIRSFSPFYQHVGGMGANGNAYYSVRREPRRPSQVALRGDGRSGYAGSEVFLSLVDTVEAPWPEQIDQLSVETLVSNRDLPLLMPTGQGAELEVMTESAFKRARLLRGPSRPRMPVAEREMTWRLISHLSLNYLALRDLDPPEGAGQLRELLGLYAALADPVIGRHAQAIVSSRVGPVNRRLPVSGPLVFGRGVSVELTLDERPFAGASPYLFGAVLEQFLARHVSMNMFCELHLHSTTRGAIAYWPPRWGGRPDV